MVLLPTVQASNASIASTLPRLVAVFAGATSGIGEASLKQFVKHALEPRVYFIGREQEAADRITAELKTLNPAGEYHFIKKDTSLVKNVDEVCKGIKEKESMINLLFLTQGTLLSGVETSENLHLPTALNHYCRIRFIINLLPLLQAAPTLRRVVSVCVGGKEGPINTEDPQTRKPGMSFLGARGHLASRVTLSLEALAQKAPDVSFIHAFPGPVKGGLGRSMKGFAMGVLKGVFAVIGPLIYVPLVEVGERHVWLCTSAMYPARVGGNDGVPIPKGVEVAKGTDGKTGSGVYTVDRLGESAGDAVVQVLEKLRKEGAVDQVWADAEGEFKRITGAVSG